MPAIPTSERGLKAWRNRQKLARKLGIKVETAKEALIRSRSQAPITRLGREFLVVAIYREARRPK